MILDGLQLNQYRLLHLLGAGSMGEVYLAEDSRIIRQVAIKVIRGDEAPYLGNTGTAGTNRLFLREVKAIAALQHPHILPLFDYGNVVMSGSTFGYMVMPYCQEGSLDGWFRKREPSHVLSFQQVAHILEQAADALQYAHDGQIVHQDVKLSNFLIQRWRTPELPDILLADFGIAKSLSAHSHTSHTVRGTPTSMAPEQWESHSVAATDQYALAIMVYQLLTGSAPFQGGPRQVMYQHLMTQPQPPSTRRPEIPASVDTVVLKALMKKPQDRFETVLEFAQAFQQALASIPGPQDAEENVRQKSLNVDLVLGSEEETFLLPQRSEKVIQAASASPDAIKATPVPVQTTEASTPPPFSGKQRQDSNEQTSSQRQGFVNGKRLLMVFLVLVLVVGTAGLTFYLARSSSPVAGNPAPTSTVQPTNGATSEPSPTQLTNPYPPYTGTLALNDPLKDNTGGNSWEQGTRDQGTCTFTGGTYHANIPLATYFHSCLALSTHFTNFAFEVQMSLATGSAGGIVFNADRATTHFYYFTIDRAGAYLLKYYYDNTGDASSPLAQGSNIAFNGTGLIGVVEQGTTISLYVNRNLIQQVNVGSIAPGQVGVVTYEGDVAFSNARVWVL